MVAPEPTLRARLGAVPPLTYAGVLGVCLAAGLAGALVLAPPRTPPAYTSPPGADSGQPVSGVGAVLAGGLPSQRSGTAGARPKTAVFVGDAFTAGPPGAGGSPASASSFACLAAQKVGATCVNDGVPGTGYLAGRRGDPDLGPFGTRFAGYANAAAGRADDVGFVVVSGGGADAERSASSESAAARQFVTQAREAFPHARLIVLAPFPSGAATAATSALTSVLRSAAARSGATFVDPTSWFSADTTVQMFTPDSANLTAQGHAYVGQKVAAVLAGGR